MNKFTFDKKKPKLLSIEIDEKTFHINPYTLAVQRASDKFIKCQEPLIQKLKNQPTKKEMEELIVTSCSLVRDTINQILGKNAYDKLFAGRTLDFSEHQKLIEFLFQEIAEFCKVNTIEHESLT